jgi:hypothetical protein
MFRGYKIKSGHLSVAVRAADPKKAKTQRECCSHTTRPLYNTSMTFSREGFDHGETPDLRDSFTEKQPYPEHQ